MWLACSFSAKKKKEESKRERKKEKSMCTWLYILQRPLEELKKKKHPDNDGFSWFGRGGGGE